MNDKAKEGTFVNEDGSPVTYTNFEMDYDNQNRYYSNQVAMWEGVQNRNNGEATTKGKWTTKGKNDTCDCQACLQTTTKMDFQFTKTQSGEWAWTEKYQDENGVMIMPKNYEIINYELKISSHLWWNKKDFLDWRQHGEGEWKGCSTNANGIQMCQGEGPKPTGDNDYQDIQRVANVNKYAWKDNEMEGIWIQLAQVWHQTGGAQGNDCLKFKEDWRERYYACKDQGVVLWQNTTETTRWQQKMEGLRQTTIEQGGTLVIGQQQGLERTGFHPDGVFHGLIDEVRMWSDWKWVKNPNKPPYNG